MQGCLNAHKQQTQSHMLLRANPDSAGCCLRHVPIPLATLTLKRLFSSVQRWHQGTVITCALLEKMQEAYSL